MMPCNLRSLLLAAVILSNCISWTASRHHYTHNVSGHRSRHRRQGAGLFLSASYVLPGGEGAGWGEWGEVSPCSRTCGGGVASQKRICLQIGPDGQPQCPGGDTKYFSCQTQDCPAGSRDFREQQCSEFDDQAFRDIKYKWVPYTKSSNPCELNCMPRGERFYYRHRTKVVDGTRCNDESFDVCVNGTCEPVGCDMMLGSSAREDKCRECRGNGANCHTTDGLLDTQDLRKGYNDMLLIPEGATTIVIAERGPSNNYLALRAKNGTYYLNGDYHIDFPRSLEIAGALWTYERSQQGFAAPDKLRCLGPTNEPLYLALLLQDTNVGIEYEYSVPNELAPPRNKRYNWVHDEFSPCTATCGGGYQTRNVSCRSREELELVDEGLCEQEIKPPTNQTCGTEPCAPQWSPRPWGRCSKRCGKGGTQAREVHCTQVITNGYPSIVADKKCFDLLGPKPELFQECNQNATCPLWFAGPWKPCDKLCDEGKQTRQVVCYQKNGRKIEVLADEECDQEKPEEEQKCMLQLCDGVDWVVSEWSGCDSCLSTVRSRTAVCATKEHKVVNETFCAYHEAPETQQPCDKTKLPACEVQWYATQWSKCSVECGKGLQTRKVFCGLFDGASVLKVDDERCAGQTKYNDTKECEIPKDKCPSQWFAGPWSTCTKKCGGGDQFRRVMCLRGEKPATDCDEEQVLDSAQFCNTHSCNKDELLPVDHTAPPVEDEYEDCDEEDDYSEVGLDADAPAPDALAGEPTLDSFLSSMFSDSPSGSGYSSLSTAELESTFPVSTLTSEELMTTEGSGMGDSTDLFSSSTYESTTEVGTGSTGDGSTLSTEEVSSNAVSGSTAFKQIEDSGSTDDVMSWLDEITTSTSESTEGSSSQETDSSLSTESSSTYDYSESDSSSKSTEESLSSISTESSGSTTDTSDSSKASDSTELSESTEATSDKTITEDGSSTTDSSSNTSSDATDTGETESTIETSPGPSTTENTLETDNITETSSTVSGIEDTSSTSETVSTEPTETDSTDTTETTEATETTETSTTDVSESTEPTETTETSSTEVSGSTEPTETTESGITVVSGSTETTESGPTEATETTESSTTEVTGSTEPTETTESGGTEGTETTESSTTEASESTEPGSTEGTETTETGSTEPTGTETTELSGSTEPTETTETGSTEPTETTETGSTEPTETTETGSTEPTETTETGSTEPTETTETGSTEPTETTEATETSETESTESTVTEESTTGGSTETTEEGSTLSSLEPESSSESSTTEGAISELTTRWDFPSTVEMYTTKRARVCRPRSCLKSEFGCCPDKKTPALGPFDEGCLKPHTCKESIHLCCPDGVSPALGPNNKGCPTEPCAETLFGCCESDNKTAAEGNEQEGCPPPPPPCVSSKYGCCKDGETEATGPAKAGCPETTESTEAETDESTSMETSTASASTEAMEGCSVSEFGCCFDNETAATGPELQGCPCQASEFGCCPDGVAPAQGPELEGCVKSCNTSAYGCCPDGKTPAHGPENEGCCLLYAFGCCPDNFKPADGPHLEGCGCQYARFGCCPDNVTVATGADHAGCGCQYTPHGCCPDRHSEASGPDFEGCACHTYQFGCCPDGVTVARGPNGQGCYCQQSQFGCCGDEQTHAKGPNKEGCDCATSRHGCCPDGTMEATGPKFQGCTDKPENKQASCNLKFERGPCRNYSVNWFYDTEYGGCSRFWYGGCDGNGNRFGSKEDCEDTCVSPPPKDACKLPQIKGPCLGYNVRWYYDSERETCTNFIYGGCLGNNNNFETRELCQAQCEPERALDQCNLAIERGSCAGNFPRWGYNKESRACEEFIWGGCEGNTNRFSTEAACLLRCNPPGEPQPECSEAQNAGNCTDVEALWSFSQSENRCVPFYYTGCGGNGNKFTTREDCQEACPSAFVPELCTLPAATGDCYDYREKWYFDTKDQRCRQFYYGGCGGNGNNFNTEQECTNHCSPPPEATTVLPSAAPPAPSATTPSTAAPAPAPAPDADRSEFCFLEIDAGPCNNMEPKWAYDYTQGRCKEFQYGGCGGNQNNFPSEEYCTYYCKPTQDICQLPMLAGPCEESVMSWFYDSSSDSCSQFTYGGCDGNDNRFGSREECESRCKSGPAPATTPATTTTTQAPNLPQVCTISQELEQCTSESLGEVWYYDPAASACVAHQNLDVGAECRMLGVFYSQEECERNCGAFRNIDVCRYALDAGPCREVVPKYHYNATSRRCEEFAYGGCLGGPNRFSSEQECQFICMSDADPCTLPPEPGNCNQRLVMWYYDQRNDACAQFAFGGCGGNENKFETRELCEGRCRKQPAAVTTTISPAVQTTRQPAGQEECRTPQSLEPCASNITAFYYDEATSSCKVADIGGCGHPNSYRSEEECERRCGAFRGLDVCQAQLDTGPCRESIPKFYFEAASGRCLPYAYGGCQGGPNRFSTAEECEEICASVGPAPACLQGVATGAACGAGGAAAARRWHYDVARVDCIVFAYQGCGGNQNNFLSYEECAELCRVPTSDASESSICEQYAEECNALEASCAYGVQTVVAAEGCERCACAAPVACEAQRRECDAMRCQYGVERTTGVDGCETCSCAADPCKRHNCTSEERCEPAPYRDPQSQQVLYSAHCVPDSETNEVLPVDCSAYIAECARISCPWGVQRTSARGCERCACVREEVDCAPLQRDCDNLKCNYGLQRSVGDDGCERCKCLEHPCSGKVCPGGERCVATPFRDPVTQEPRYSADCRTTNKPGTCPAEGLSRSTENACRVECNDDADCRGVLKCCARGCSQLCAAPAPATSPPPAATTTHGPEVPSAPQASAETEAAVAAAEGGKATLRCLFHGNPPPRITWRFGEITIDSDVDRYRLLSDGALEIVSLYRNDSGVYICLADNELGTAQQEITLNVNDPVVAPAQIAGAAGAAVTGELGRALAVRCLAYGHPAPNIYWYRGNGGPMVPYSDERYEARGQVLLLRRLALDTLGEYECQAYNGEGRAASWRVTVRAFRPDDASVPDGPYLVARDARVPPPAPPPAPPAPSTPEPELEINTFIVPVSTKLLAAATRVAAGAQLSVPCEVDGYPEPAVHWTKDNLPVTPSDRLWITGSRLTIPRAAPSDSGEYGCHAANAFSSHSSTVRITVQELYIPEKCVDNPLFANCALIVQSRFCTHKYYSRFCCKSCVEAGQLDPHDVEMQADMPFKK